MARKAGQGKEEEESRARQQEEKTPVRDEEKTPACDGRGHHVVEQAVTDPPLPSSSPSLSSTSQDRTKRSKFPTHFHLMSIYHSVMCLTSTQELIVGFLGETQVAQIGARRQDKKRGRGREEGVWERSSPQLREQDVKAHSNNFEALNSELHSVYNVLDLLQGYQQSWSGESKGKKQGEERTPEGESENRNSGYGAQSRGCMKSLRNFNLLASSLMPYMGMGV
ncbi:hypothetical protein STEG23_028021 [Scotinomys teguina]